MMKRVLLSGAAGFLGAHVLRYLLAETDADVVCPVTFKHKGVPERLTWAVAEDQWERVEVIRHDCATPVGPQTAERFGDVDTIVNLASDTHPPRSVEHPVAFMENNHGIGLHLLEYARTRPELRAFVQISTDSVYGPAPGGMHREWAPIVPNNPYAASKADQENMAIAWWRCFGVPTVIAATMNPMGETQDREKFLPMTIGKLLAGEPILIHCNADGVAGGRTYIYAADVAEALLHILKHLPPSRFGEGVTRPDRWNIVGREEVDNLVAAQTIARALGMRQREWRWARSTVDRPEHGHRYAMSGAKLATSGWEAPTDIYDAIARTARWTREHPIWLA
jgi:dTDP-glucose 4,6-dehydratase